MTCIFNLTFPGLFNIIYPGQAFGFFNLCACFLLFALKTSPFAVCQKLVLCSLKQQD